jgi:O-antigen/teichoic acid export membrane protein
LRKLIRHGVVGQSALAFTATMLPSAFFFVYHFALSRQLGIERYGALSSLISLLVISSVPSGIAAVVVMKYTAEFRAVEDTARLRAFVYRSLQVASAVGLFAFLGAALGAAAIASYLQIPDVEAIRIVALVLGLSLVVPLLRAVLQGSQDYGRLAISMTIDAVGRAVFGIALVHAGFGLVGAIGGIAIATGLSLAYTVVAVLRPLRGSWLPLTIDVRRLIQSSAGVATSAVFGTMLGFVDVPMVKHFFSAHDAGLYGAASLAGKVVLYALGFVPMLVIPKAAARIARGEPTPIVWMSALGVTAVVSIPALLALAYFPQLILRVLTGPAFLGAAPLLVMYGTAMAFLAGLTALSSYCVAVHRFHYLVPLGVAAIGEVLAIQQFHESLTQILVILIAANAIGFFGTLVLGIGGGREAARVSLPSKNAA